MGRSFGELKQSVHKRDRGRCQYCGLKVEGRERTLDHLLPKSLGGKFRRNNLVTCCRDCNYAKGNLLPLNFIWLRIAGVAG